jgi:hypothetical protein
VALFGIPNLLSLIYEDVFDLDAAQRGLVTAAVEPLQIVGILLSMPLVARLAASTPQFLSRFVAVVGVVDGILLACLAYAPNVGVAVALNGIVSTSIGTLAPAFFAMLSLVSPPHVRSAAFTTLSIFAVPGIALFLPAIGALSDAVGVQSSMLLMVPISLAAGLILSTAGRTLADDIAAVQAATVQDVAGDDGGPPTGPAPGVVDAVSPNPPAALGLE